VTPLKANLCLLSMMVSLRNYVAVAMTERDHCSIDASVLMTQNHAGWDGSPLAAAAHPGLDAAHLAEWLSQQNA